MGLGTANIHRHPKMSTAKNSKIDKIKSCCLEIPIVYSSPTLLMSILPESENFTSKADLILGNRTNKLGKFGKPAPKLKCPRSFDMPLR